MLFLEFANCKTAYSNFRRTINITNAFPKNLKLELKVLGEQRKKDRSYFLDEMMKVIHMNHALAWAPDIFPPFMFMLEFLGNKTKKRKFKKREKKCSSCLVKDEHKCLAQLSLSSEGYDEILFEQKLFREKSWEQTNMKRE